MAVCDYRSALQSATATLHEQIDGAFGGFDLASRDGLMRFLAAQAIGMRACQPRIIRFARHWLGCSAPDYAQILGQDLALLGIALERLPLFDVADDFADGRADAGVFYVVAGSRMGAAVLRNRATAPTPNGPANTACGFFAAGEGPAMWRLFREWLASEAVADGPAMPGLPDMIAAATATFELFAKAAEWTAAQPAMPARCPGSLGPHAGTAFGLKY